MAAKKRKKKQQKQISEENFSASPFTQLKGLSVRQEGTSVAGVKAVLPPTEEPVVVDDDQYFLEAMERLGGGSRLDTKQGKITRPQESTETGEAEDEALFLKSLGQVDHLFRDEIPVVASEPLPEVPSRLRRQNRVQPGARIDLHGLTREQAVEKVAFFLQNCVHHGFATVLIITGKGKTTGAEPVVRNRIEEYLGAEGRSLVREWNRAPRHLGGNGALVVFLKTG